MNTLYNIIESMDEELYHFTNINDIIDICTDDAFIFSEDDYHNKKGYNYYMSTSRQRNTFVGYPQALNNPDVVRIIFYKNKLKSKFDIESIDYTPGSKKHVMSSTWDNTEEFDKYYNDIMKQSSVESEDMMYSKTRLLKDLHKYIKEIQLKKGTYSTDQLRLLLRYSEIYHVPVKTMEPKQFNYGR